VQVAGRLNIDDGAARALRSGGKSLLPIGVRNIEGEFERGAVVACVDPEGVEIARGLVNYSAPEARRIAGRPSGDIESTLGYVEELELIHRDNMVLI
jgi:glutamate 5-kinase